VLVRALLTASMAIATAIAMAGCLPVCYAGAGAAAAPANIAKARQEKTVAHDRPVGSNTQP